MRSAKLKQRLLRISLVLLAGWLAGVVAVLNDDFCATTYWKSEKQIQETDIVVSSPSVDCLQWGPLNSKLVARTGGYAVNWRVRREAFVVLLGYPLALGLALTAAGAALTWIIKGFCHKA